MNRILLVVAAFFSNAAFATVTILDDPGSFSVVRTAFSAQSITVKVTDAAGNPVRNATVSYGSGYGTGFAYEFCVYFYGCNTTTAVDGTAFIGRIRGIAVGDWSSSISAYVVNGSSVTSYGTVSRPVHVLAIGAPMVLEAIDGNNQSAVLGTVFAKPITVRVTKSGQPLSSLDVSFTWTSGAITRVGNSAATTLKVTTDVNGIAVSPALTAVSGLGASQVQFSTMDNVEASLMTGHADLKITEASGNTWLPLSPLWWSPDSPGWGLSLPQRREKLFPVLYTYNGGKPVWYTIDGSWSAGFGSGYGKTFVRYTGTPYYDYDATKVAYTAVSDGGIAFPSPSLDLTSASVQATSSSGYPGLARANVVPFRFAPATPRPAKGVSDIWWGGPSQSGWGISIAEDGGNLFAAWFTYGADGQSTWFSMPEGAWVDDQTWKGPVYKTAGSSPMEVPWRSGNTPYSATKVGDFTLRFSGTNSATFDYNVEGHVGTLQLQRFDF